MKRSLIPILLILAISISCSAPKWYRDGLTTVFWIYNTQDSLRYELDLGPLISITNWNYRFPESKAVMIDFDYQFFRGAFSKCRLRHIYRKTTYKKYGADSCEIRGGYYRDDFTTVLYDTPVSRLDKFYSDINRRDRYTNLLLFDELRTHTPTSIFDLSGKLIVDFGETGKELQENLQNLFLQPTGSSLYVKAPEDTFCAYAICSYEPSSGLVLLGKSPFIEMTYLLLPCGRTNPAYADTVGIASELSAAYLQQVSEICASFCMDKYSRIIFPVKLKVVKPEET